MPPEQDPSPVPLCASAELEERGRAHTFDVLHFRDAKAAKYCIYMDVGPLYAAGSG